MKVTRLKALSLIAITAGIAIAQNGFNTGSTSEHSGSAFTWLYSCGGLSAQIWTDGQGWHTATCLEMGNSLNDLHDYRNVSVMTEPDLVQMLTYSQYEHHFRVKPSDFRKAQEGCRKIMGEGYAAPEIIAQCRKTIAGVVPYGLKLLERNDR